ncbi:MAG: hypothetical protein R2881_08350 [Eubacteriales bacterium]
MTLYNLDAFIDGDMDEMLNALSVVERSEMLSGSLDWICGKNSGRDSSL